MKKRYIVLSVIVLVIALALIWWLIPVRFLRGADPAEVSKIKVFNGSSGNCFELSAPEEISFLVENIQQAHFKKEKLSIGMGTYYNITVLSENDKEIDFFILDDRDTMRKGPIFYHCNGELDEVEQYLINIETAQFPREAENQQ